jgi:osmotically-inducible protein OsmY
MARGLLLAVALGAAPLVCFSGTALGAPPPQVEKDIVVTATRLADAAMAGRVLIALQEHPYIFVDHVTVTAENGIVRLEGVVQDLSDLREVLKVARRIAGKGRVVNEISFQPNDDDAD